MNMAAKAEKSVANVISLFGVQPEVEEEEVPVGIAPARQRCSPCGRLGSGQLGRADGQGEGLAHHRPRKDGQDDAHPLHGRGDDERRPSGRDRRCGPDKRHAGQLL